MSCLTRQIAPPDRGARSTIHVHKCIANGSSFCREVVGERHFATAGAILRKLPGAPHSVMHLLHRTSAGTLIGLCFTRSVLAQEPSQQDDQHPQEVMIWGDGLPLRDRSAPTQVLGEREIESQASGRIEGAFKDAGVTQYRRSDARSAHPTSQGVSLRGLGGNASSRMLVLLDGVPQTDPFFGWLAWPGYDALPWTTATVEPGGGSGLEGPGALAGTLRLQTRTPERLVDFGGGALGGSRGSFTTRTRGAFPTGPVLSSLGVSFERGDGFFLIPEQQRGSVDQRAPYQQMGATLRSELGLSRDVTVRALGRAFLDQRHRGLPHSENGQRGFDVSLHAGSPENARAPWSALVYVQDRQFNSSFASISEHRDAARQVLDQFHVPSVGLGSRLSFSPHLGRHVKLEIGADYRRVAGKSQERFLFVDGDPQRERESGGTTDDWGAFCGVAWRPFPALTFSANTRLDLWWMYEGFRTERELQGEVLSAEHFTAKSDWENTSRVGVGVELARGVEVRSATYTGFRLPTLNELYRPYRVGADATAANPELEPERIWGTEAGLTLNHPRGAKVALTLFENRLRNAIANVTLAQGPGQFEGVGFVAGTGSYLQRRNLDALRSVGVEVVAALDAEQLLGFRGGRLDVRYSWVDAKVQSSGAAGGLDGLRPAQVPEHSLSTTLSWTKGAQDTGAFLTLRYIGAQYEDDLNLVQLNEALTVDLVTNFRLTRGVLLTLRAENLTDAQVEASRSSSGLIQLTSPRTFWVGFDYAITAPAASERQRSSLVTR